MQVAPSRSPSEAAGEVLKLRTIGPFTLREMLCPAGLVLPHHTHREAYITFVIEGSFQEMYSTGATVCRPGAVRFLPAGETHANEVESELRCLHISGSPEAFDQFARQSVIPKTPAQINGLTATWLANRLFAEFSKDDPASAVAVEGLVLAILAEIARSESRPNSTHVPGWLRQATEIVESRFLERLSLAEIAAEVGVHYVHLSRQFHKYNRCTIGEMIRRRRVQYASHLLAHSQTPLAEIALICGFSDQSHLSFLFKRYMGLSPSKFRSLAGSDEGPRSLYAVAGAETVPLSANASVR
ncbi:MAG TPA: AraC family transcriptional regulator [Bryobacteraceae bacterium]|nr:AraC family transcriptional regulator [Bryobacteraceae bacterium]